MATDKTFRVHLLDMGETSYGDCILVELGTRRILVDGAHPGDGASGAEIASQLSEILNEEAPHAIDLLVITHCHGDHIGCLAELLEDKTIEVKSALVADPDLGFPEKAHDTDVGLSTDAEKILALLAEESVATLSDVEIARLLDGGAVYRADYEHVLDLLEESDVEILVYGRNGLGPSEATAAIRSKFPGAKVVIPGPTIDALETCRDTIASYMSKKRHDLQALDNTDAARDPVALYRAMVDSESQAGIDASFDGDVDSAGPAKNNQSILLVVEANGHRVLLCGDMQFAKSEMTGFNPTMRALLDATADAGPFSFVKLSHHGSYNGFNDAVLRAWGDTEFFGVSTGIANTPHPHPTVVQTLRNADSDVSWCRTDRNGRVTVTLAANRKPSIKVARGKLNDTRANPGKRDEATNIVVSQRASAETAPSPVLPVSTERVEVITRIPHMRTRVTVSISVEPGDSAGTDLSSTPTERQRIAVGGPGPGGVASSTTARKQVGGGRELPQLLFVLPELARLERRIGREEAHEVAEILKASGHALVSLRSSPEDIEACRQEVLDAVKRRRTEGIVLIGGYDLVPSEHRDLLTPELREKVVISNGDSFDPDNWIIWSDDAYGDVDSDGFPDLPVSRIPDGQRADVLLAALTAGARPRMETRSGVRNVLRPYADQILALLPGTDQLLVSAPTRPKDVPLTVGGADNVYLVLHGRYDRLHVYTGDTDPVNGWAGGEAFGSGNVSERAAGSVIFCACCWGGLPTSRPAAFWSPGMPLPSHTPAESIAMTFLRSGARAFVGATGVHIPPDPPDTFQNNGGPLHVYFWRALLGDGQTQGQAPAAALLTAKRAYRANRPYYSEGNPDADRSALDDAIEIKHTFQFTCLGLGW